MGKDGNGYDDGRVGREGMDDHGQNEQERAEERALPIRRDRLVGHEIEPLSRTEPEAEARKGDELKVGGIERRDVKDEGAKGEVPEHQGVDEDAARENAGPKAPAPKDEAKADSTPTKRSDSPSKGKTDK